MSDRSLVLYSVTLAVQVTTSSRALRSIDNGRGVDTLFPSPRGQPKRTPVRPKDSRSRQQRSTACSRSPEIRRSMEAEPDPTRRAFRIAGPTESPVVFLITGISLCRKSGCPPGAGNNPIHARAFTFTPAAGTSYPDLKCRLGQDARLSESQQARSGLPHGEPAA